LILQPRSRNPARYSFVILDEPFHDVKKLLEVLHELVSQGNTVVVIEHNLELVSFVIPGRRASVEPGIHSHEC
jgi:excinuclease UvrABC ATPase subunit